MGTRFTAKEQEFINRYLIFLNGTKAARGVYDSDDDNILASIASENLRKPKIRKEIDKRLQENVMSANEVLRRWSEMASGDLSLFKDVQNLGDLEDHPFSFLVKKFEKDKGGNIKIELHDPQKALDTLARYYSLLTDKLEVDVNIEMKDWIKGQKEALKNG